MEHHLLSCCRPWFARPTLEKPQFSREVSVAPTEGVNHNLCSFPSSLGAASQCPLQVPLMMGIEARLSPLGRFYSACHSLNPSQDMGTKAVHPAVPWKDNHFSGGWHRCPKTSAPSHTQEYPLLFKSLP